MFRIYSFICLVSAMVVLSYADNISNANAYNKYMSPEAGINPMSGTVALQKEIASISDGQVKASFSIKYSGNIFEEVKKNNKDVKSGLVGLGWSFGRTKIVCNCKNNAFLPDDDYYLVTADGNRYKIFNEKAWRKHFNVGYSEDIPNDKWWIEGNPFWKVERFEGEENVGGENWSFVKGWKITDAEGIVHSYGDLSETKSLTGPTPNATEYDLIWLQYQENGSWHPAYGLMEPAYGGHPSYYPVAWNLSKETSLEGSFLKYDYEQVSEKLFGYFEWADEKKWDSGSRYTKETYLKSVTASNFAKIEFFYEKKGDGIFFGEYVDDEGRNEELSDEGSDMFREKFSRKYLSHIETYRFGDRELEKESDVEKQNRYLGKVTFCYSPLQQGSETSYVKRLLSAIRFFNQDSKEIDYEEYSYYTNLEQAKPSYSKEYSYPLGALYAIKGKECGWVEYTYRYESLGNGHVEELPLDFIYGQGRLEDGTAYLVGRVGNELKIYTRILGRWIKTDLKQNDGNFFPKVDRVEFGDAGWFLAVKNLDDGKGEAYVFEWNGKEWQKMVTESFRSSEHFYQDTKAERVMAGPDYALRLTIDDEKWPGYNDGYTRIEFFWTKWGGALDAIELKGTDDNESMADYYKVVPLKNFMLVKYMNGAWCGGNCTGYYVYAFKNGTFKSNNTFEDSGIDSDNNIYLNGSFVADVGEGVYWWDYSRVIINAWNGHNWVRQLRYKFSNKDEADIQASGNDFFAVRYNGNRHLRVFSFENNLWDSEAYHEKFFTWRASNGFEWNGYGSKDFFVTTSSYRRRWYNSVQKNKRLRIFYNKNGKDWQKKDLDRLQDYGFGGDAKKPIVGMDWFVEKNASRFAWVWKKNSWELEDLSQEGYLSKKEFSDSENIYSLGSDIIAASKPGITRLIYKVRDSFLDAFGTYTVRSKTIYEPVADRSVVYGYSFLTKNNSKNAVAFDEASNTPLMDVMKVEIMKVDKNLPAAKGVVERILCDLDNGKESVAIGSVCQENQWSMNQSSMISRTKSYYERKRFDWPYPVYLDQEISKVQLNRGIKTVVKNEYSQNNGLLKKRIKKVGNKQTIENFVYVNDFENLTGNEKKIVDNLNNLNRLGILAGAYSCIPNCTDGTIVAASASGLSCDENKGECPSSGKKDSEVLYKVSSSWKFSPKKKVFESGLKAGIRSIALASKGNSDWERQSFNSKYSKKHVVESVEGQRNIKVASFYDNSESGKLLGNAANCGIDEGLMLSGETCNVDGWTGCEIHLLDGSAKEAIGCANDDCLNYGRFSPRVIKLTKGKPLVGTIQNAKNIEYTFSAWLQYGAENGTLSLNVNDSSVPDKSWDVKPVDLPNDSVGKWTKIEWKGTLNGKTQIALSAHNISTFIRLQDVRIIPSISTSTTSYWNPKWEKIETTVDSKGVASYVNFDDLGREYEHFSETAEGDVYLSSRTTYVDGNCTSYLNGSDLLTSLRINEQPQKLPEPDINGNHEATFVLSNSNIYIDFTTLLSSDGVKYKLYPEGQEPEKWVSPECGALCDNPSFSFKTDKKSWILKIDVQPYSTGLYVFKLKKKENDWVEYGSFEGIAEGKNPRYINDFDSSYVVFKDPSKRLYANNFDGNMWSPQSEELFTDYVADFDVFTGNKGNFLTYLSRSQGNNDGFLNDEESPRVFKYSGNSWIGKELSDKVFRASDVKLAETSLGTPVLFYNKVAVNGTIRNPDNFSETHVGIVNVNALAAMKWNESNNKFEDFGALPVLANSTFTLNTAAKTVDFKKGIISSYEKGLVSENEAVSLDAVSGPEEKLYVAYIGTSKYFSTCGEDGKKPCDAPFVYVKRFYDANEVNEASQNIWAGVSVVDGAPLYQGDILSWSENTYDAIGGVEKLKLASDGLNLYLAISYKIAKEEDDELSSSSNSLFTFSSSSSTGSLLKPTHALSVFKGLLLKNYVANGKTYSTYLKWEPLRDLSVKATFMANTLQEEQIRIAYMNENDDFDFAVRRLKIDNNEVTVPYLMFRNKDNDEAISVISFKNNQWLSIGNPGFAYPNMEKGSADLGVNDKGNPFVVFQTKESKENIGRLNKIVGMHYNPKDAKDLTISELTTNDFNFNRTCAFRPYILHYIANFNNEENFVFNVKLSKPSDVKEILIASKKNILQSVTDFSKSISVALEQGENSLEIRVVGIDGSTLSYKFDLYRYFYENPNVYTVGLMANIQTGFSENGALVVGVEPKVTKTNGSIEFDIHFEAGWTLVIDINGKKTEYNVASTVQVPIDALPLTEGYLYNKDGRIVPVEIQNASIPIDNPEIYPWAISSSSGNGNNGSSSSDMNQNQNSSSSSVLNCDMSDNVPDDIRNITTARIFTSNEMNIADRVVIKGDVFSGTQLSIGVETSVDGDAYSATKVNLRNRSNVKNVYYGVDFDVQNGASYESSTHLSSVVVPLISSFNFIYGEGDILIESSQSNSLSAGMYRDFSARTDAKVTFSAGDYYFRNFYTDSRVNLVFAPGTRIWISGDLRIGNDCHAQHFGQMGDLFVYVGGNVIIETNVDLHAVLVAPNTSVSISSGTRVYGYIFGKSLNVQPNVTIE